MNEMEKCRALMTRARLAKEQMVRLMSGPIDLPPLVSVWLGDKVFAGQVTEQWNTVTEMGMDVGAAVTHSVRQLWVKQGKPAIHQLQFVSEGYQVSEPVGNESLADLFEKHDPRVTEGLSVYLLVPDALGGSDCWVINSPFKYTEDGLDVIWHEPHEIPPYEAMEGNLMEHFRQLMSDTEKVR